MGSQEPSFCETKWITESPKVYTASQVEQELAVWIAQGLSGGEKNGKGGINHTQ